MTANLGVFRVEQRLHAFRQLIEAEIKDLRPFQCKLEICRSSEFAVDIAIAVEQAEVTARAHELCLRDELVARDDLALERDVLHAAEERDLAAVRIRIQDGEAGDLRHCLEDQDARHERGVREMTQKVRLIHGDVLDARRRLERL